MSTKDKLIERFKRQPKDFTFDELARLLGFLGFAGSSKGKTSGSRVKFNNDALKIAILVHKPHAAGAPVKETALKEIYDYLNINKLI
jgi:hypothetical protein